uniref:Methyltransferase domain-containing protein n=1 Tax=Arion vulgaris TaxID=1028688 RepID=A0A0B6ZCW6_9EUPU
MDVEREDRCSLRMLTSGQIKYGVLFCVVLIVALILLNMRFNAIETLLSSHDTSSNKVEGTNVIPVFSQDDNEETFNKDLGIIRRKGYNNLANRDLDKLSTEELTLTIHSYPDNTDTICRRKLRMGNIGDGGWEICDDFDVRPRLPCIIYSFGINNDFTFDDDAALVYGCQVYSFDPSMTNFADKVIRSNFSTFYKIGLSDKSYIGSNKWKMETFANIKKMMGHQNTIIDVLKIDIESSEWAAVPEMASSGQLKNIRQIMMEYHVTGDSRDYILPRLKAIQAIENAGYKRYYVHKNPACGKRIHGYPIIRTQCYEVYYVKR